MKKRKCISCDEKVDEEDIRFYEKAGPFCNECYWNYRNNLGGIEVMEIMAQSFQEYADWADDNE